MAEVQRLVRCKVVSASMNKSRVGKVERLVKHPIVGKYIRKTTKIMFHDEENACQVGDEVSIKACRPLSGKKSHKLHEIVKRGGEA